MLQLECSVKPEKLSVARSGPHRRSPCNLGPGLPRRPRRAGIRPRRTVFGTVPLEDATQTSRFAPMAGVALAEGWRSRLSREHLSVATTLGVFGCVVQGVRCGPIATKQLRMERETGVEPATPTLARLCSTTELFPLSGRKYAKPRRRRQSQCVRPWRRQQGISGRRLSPLPRYSGQRGTGLGRAPPAYSA